MNTRTRKASPDRSNGQRARLRALALTLATVLATSLLTLAPAPPAPAANWSGPTLVHPTSGERIGSFRVPGQGSINFYCIEPGIPSPVTGTDLDRGYQSSIVSEGPSRGQNTRTLTATTLARINLLVSKYGQTSSNSQAAMVAIAVEQVANPAAHAAKMSPWGWNYYLNFPWPSGWTAALNQINAYVAEANNYNPTLGGGSASMTFQVDARNNYEGTLTIATLSPGTGVTGTIVLTNGVFTATGSDTFSGPITAGMALDIYGVPPEGQPDYKIAANGTFTAPGAGGYAGEIHLIENSAGRQRIGGPGPIDPINFTAFAEDPFDRATVFAPIVTTHVANKYVAAGDTFTDVLTFGTADIELEGENPGDPSVTIHNPWYQTESGEYVRVAAQGTLYGPFTSEPVESASPPPGAPVAATATVTTTSTAGPTTTYPATTAATATTAGYYTWVWTINYLGQPIETPPYLVDDYSFADRFGQVAETHILPAGIEAVSQVSVAEIPLSGTMTDTLTVSVVPGSAWLADSTGTPIPITFRGEAWLWPGPDAPAVSATVPSGASLLDSVTFTTNAPGAFVSPPVTAPSAGGGWVSWVWSIRTVDQPPALQGLVSEWADEFGLPAETTQLLTPTVSTVAVDEVALGEPAHDVATVGGTLPAINPSLTFAAYLQPDFGPATCTTAAYDSIASPIEVTELGEYRSPEVIFTTAGTYFWVETLWSHDGQIIHQGDCGAANETTLVHQVIVTTVAVDAIVLGQDAFDTAYVRGTPPAGSYLEFAAYLQSDDVATCDATTLAFTSTPVMLAGPGEYQSPSARFTQPGTYFWVEYLYDSTDTLLHAGECGAVTEITAVSPPLVVTGYDSASGALLAGVAALLTLIGLGGLIIVRRRRAATA